MSTRINQVKYKPPGINQNKISIKRNSSNRVSGNRWLGRTCGFRLLKRSIIMSPVKFIKHLGGKVAKALCLGRRSSPRVSSSSGRSRPSLAPIDTHRAEAIEDCIEFINSSSLPRSSSVSANPSRHNGETNFEDAPDRQITTIGSVKERVSVERAVGDWNAEFNRAKVTRINAS
ncbi:unnamed protein product [Dovyalis caffra]|uniref:Josephin-like protein n=1 Tax=Dovyalis caffra TaxID=77055 RepID=A0AAV1RB56_9ROSI|nr:unnamed protein product [Dovyalis caffra]